MFGFKKESPRVQFTYGRDGNNFVINCSVGGEPYATLHLSPEEARLMIDAHSAFFPTAPSQAAEPQEDPLDSTPE